MGNKLIFIAIIALIMNDEMHAQEYSIVIKGGHVIDPGNNINETMDIAIKDRKIISVAKNIDPSGSIQVVHAEGLYVTPGLIDIHVHVFNGTNLDRQYSNGPNSLPPDGFTFRVGVTTVVDAGCAGWRNCQAWLTWLKRGMVLRRRTGPFTSRYYPGWYGTFGRSGSIHKSGAKNLSLAGTGCPTV